MAVIRTLAHHSNIPKEMQLRVVYIFYRFEGRKLWEKTTQLCQLDILLDHLPKESLCKNTLK